MISRSYLTVTLFFLILISFGYVATDIYLPSFPAISAYFAANEAQLQTTLFVYLLSFAFTPLIFGPVSDHIGRKKVIVFGLTTSLFATMGCFASPNIKWFIACRFLQGIGCGAVVVGARAAVTDLFSGKALAKQISNITMLLPLVLTAAPVLGGFLQESFGWKAVFLFLIGYIISILVSMCFFAETLNHEFRQPSKRKFKDILSIYREVLSNKLFVLYALGMVIPSIGVFAYLTSSPFLFQVLIGLSPSEYGLLSLGVGGTIMLSSFVNSRLLNTCSIKALLIFGSACIMTSGLLMLVFHLMGIVTTWSVLVPMLIFFICMPFSNANAASSAMHQIRTHFGTANALITTAQFLAGSLGSFIFALIPESSALPLALCLLTVGILTAFNLSIAFKQKV